MKNYKRHLLLTSFIFVMAFFSISSLEVGAQTQTHFQPVELYRFRVSNNNLGHFLTPNYSEGVNKGYTFENVVGYIYVPEFGFTPMNPGLRAVRAWKVNENGRIYYYYSAWTTSVNNSNYTPLGILGYMYNFNQNEATVSVLGGGTLTFPLYKVKSCYSQSYGYWHGKLTPINVTSNPAIYSLEQLPTSSYDCNPIHETIGGGILTTRGTGPNANPQVPESGAGYATKGDSNDSPLELFQNTPPPPSCDVNEENACYMQGGFWDPDNCFCDDIPN